MSDVVDRHVVMLAPEEWHGIEALALAQHVERSDLALALGHHPVLDADPAAGMRIGPAHNIAGGVNAGRAGFEELVHRNAAIERKPGLLRKRKARPHADADANEVHSHRAATLERGAAAVDAGDSVLQAKHDAVLLVQPTNEVAHL